MGEAQRMEGAILIVCRERSTLEVGSVSYSNIYNELLQATFKYLSAYGVHVCKILVGATRKRKENTLE